MPANAASGLSSFSANQTTSFFFVSGFGSGAYSAKLLNGTKQRFSGLSQARQCGEEVFRTLLTDFPNELTPRLITARPATTATADHSPILLIPTIALITGSNH